jgi:hypothetical protein
MISVMDLYSNLLLWGYEASLEPMENKAPGRIDLTYDMKMKPEDIGMTSYEVKHEIALDWIEAQPDTIAASIITLMKHLGVYAMNDRFEIGEPKITRGNGTMYKIKVSVYWIQWVTID